MKTIVRCECGVKLGIFRETDDHGSIEMECPSCWGWCEIHNQMLMMTKKSEGMTLVIKPHEEEEDNDAD